MASSKKSRSKTSALPSKFDVVLALDIGTSFSGYAYSDRKGIKKFIFHWNQWKGNTTIPGWSKAPTVVLLDDEKKFDSFGYAAEERYAKHLSENTNMQCYRFRDFKMKLYNEKNISDSFEISDDRNYVLVPAIDIFAFTIKAIKGHFEENIRSNGLDYDSSSILHVVTVPAIWSESAKYFMKKAAIKAGISEDQLMLVLEPEAAALFCQTLPERMLTPVGTFETGFKYMVVDLGGGTLDIVVHMIMEDGTLAELYKASGGACGGTVVDEEFKKFIFQIFKNENCLKQLWEKAPLDALELEREFEAKKRQVAKENSGILRLKLPQRLRMFANTNLNEAKQITFDHIKVEDEEFKSFFDGVMNEIINVIEKILKNVGKIDFIILVGGFSCSGYLREGLKSHLGFSNIQFLSPFDPDLVVLQGAVLFGYNPQAVSARISRYTYGIGVLGDYDAMIHPKCKYGVVDGMQVCQDIFHVLAYEGELLKYDDEKKYSSESSHRSKERKFLPIKIELFQAENLDKGQLAFVTDEGIKSVGKIVCSPPKNGWPNTVHYETKFFFGQTNIRVENYETANKEKLNQHLI